MQEGGGRSSRTRFQGERRAVKQAEGAPGLMGGGCGGGASGAGRGRVSVANLFLGRAAGMAGPGRREREDVRRAPAFMENAGTLGLTGGGRKVRAVIWRQDEVCVLRAAIDAAANAFARRFARFAGAVFATSSQGRALSAPAGAALSAASEGTSPAAPSALSPPEAVCAAGCSAPARCNDSFASAGPTSS